MNEKTRKCGITITSQFIANNINVFTLRSASTRIAQDRVDQTQSAEKSLTSADGVLLRQKSVVSPARVQDLIGSMEGCRSKGGPKLSSCSSCSLNTKAGNSNGVACFCFGMKIAKYRAESGKEGIGSIEKLGRCN